MTTVVKSIFVDNTMSVSSMYLDTREQNVVYLSQREGGLSFMFAMSKEQTQTLIDALTKEMGVLNDSPTSVQA